MQTWFPNCLLQGLYQLILLMQAEEIACLQKLEKQLSQIPELKIICNQLVLKLQNPPLLQYLREFFNFVINSPAAAVFEKAISSLNEMLLQKYPSEEARIATLKDKIQHKNADLMAVLYERALLISLQEGEKQMSYNHQLLILNDASPSEEQCSKKIKEKIDAIYKTPASVEECEELLFGQLTPAEQDLFNRLFAKQPKNQEMRMKKQQQMQQFQEFKDSLPPELQQRIQAAGDDLNQVRRTLFLKDPTQNQLYHRLWHFDFNHKLQRLAQVATFKNNNNRKQTNHEEELNTLQRDFKEKGPQVSLSARGLKYFYKILKLRTLSGENRFAPTQMVQMRLILIEHLKQESKKHQKMINRRQIVWEKQWEVQYLSVYEEMAKGTQSHEERINDFQFIKSIQDTYIAYMRFRWNYLYLFMSLIVDTSIPEEDLELIINKAFEMLKNTGRGDLYQSFDKLLERLNQLIREQLGLNYQLSFQINLHFDTPTLLRKQLDGIHRKLVEVWIQLNQSQLISNYQNPIHDLMKIEVQLFKEANQNLVIQQMTQNPRSNQPLQRVIDKMSGNNQEKDEKRNFYFCYLESYRQRVNSLFGRSEQAQKRRLYTEDPEALRNDSQSLGSPYKQIFDREKRHHSFVEQAAVCAAWQQERLNPQLKISKIVELYCLKFLDDNYFVFYLPNILRGLIYFIQKNQSQYIQQKVERARYFSYGFPHEQFEKLIQGTIAHQEPHQSLYEFDPARMPIDKQLLLAQRIYNAALSEMTQSKPIGEGKPLAEWKEPFTIPRDLEGLNSARFNTNLILIQRMIDTEEQFGYFKPIKSFKELQDYIFQLDQIIQRDGLEQQAEARVLEEHPATIKQTLTLMQRSYTEFKQYKTQLIQEAQGNLDYRDKLVELFSRCSNRYRLTMDIKQFKDKKQLPLLELEICYLLKNSLLDRCNKDQKKITQAQQDELKQIYDILNRVMYQRSYSNSVDFMRDLQERKPSNAGPSSLFAQYVEECRNLRNKLAASQQQSLQATPVAQRSRNIISSHALQRKLNSLRQMDPKLGLYQQEEGSVLQFIIEQFESYMRNMIARVLQAALTYTDCNELKVYQNLQGPAQEQVRNFQSLQMHRQMGPQKDSAIDTVLLSKREPKWQLQYELCDYTPAQRQSDLFREYLLRAEMKQEEILLNKIRQSKWREEHPELDEVLKKKIKRGTELWTNVQEFLKKRQRSEQMDDDEDEQERNQNQQKEDEVDLSKLQGDLIELLKEFEQKQKKSRQTIQNKLENREKNNPLLIQTKIKTKTVQYVLESMPFYKKSKILYKSYIL